MAANLSALASALKVFYLDGINEQLNRQSILYDRLAKPAQVDVSGKNYTYLIRTARNVSAGTGMVDGGTFPTAGNQGWKNIIIPSKEVATAIEITGQTIRAAKGNEGAFVQGVKSEVDGATQDHIRAMNRQFHGDGRDALGFWTGADDTSGTTIDDGQGNAFPVHLEEGVAQPLDLVATADNTTLRGTAIVVTMGAENATTRSITWTGTVSGSQTGDYLIMSGTLGNQLMGLRGIISRVDPPLLSGGLHGLTVAANAFWKAQVFDNPLGTGGTLRALSLPLMERPFAQLAVKSNFSINDIKFLLCNAFVKAKYVDLCVAEKRHYNQMELDGGQDAVTFNNKPLIVDPQCRRNVLYYINPKVLDILTSSGGVQWADFLDSGQFKLKAGSNGYSDAYQAFLVFYGDMAVKSRNGNCVITDLDEAIS